jgi:hypothetical protein
MNQRLRLSIAALTVLFFIVTVSPLRAEPINTIIGTYAISSTNPMGGGTPTPGTNVSQFFLINGTITGTDPSPSFLTGGTVLPLEVDIANATRPDPDRFPDVFAVTVTAPNSSGFTLVTSSGARETFPILTSPRGPILEVLSAPPETALIAIVLGGPTPPLPDLAPFAEASNLFLALDGVTFNSTRTAVSFGTGATAGFLLVPIPEPGSAALWALLGGLGAVAARSRGRQRTAT